MSGSFYQFEYHGVHSLRKSLSVRLRKTCYKELQNDFMRASQTELICVAQSLDLGTLGVCW
jgi:hypothetical protein